MSNPYLLWKYLRDVMYIIISRHNKEIKVHEYNRLFLGQKNEINSTT